MNKQILMLKNIIFSQLFVTVPPLLSYTKDSAWVLMVLATVGNLIIPM